MYYVSVPHISIKGFKISVVVFAVNEPLRTCVVPPSKQLFPEVALLAKWGGRAVVMVAFYYYLNY